jgi:hypothetical protein
MSSARNHAKRSHRSERGKIKYAKRHVYRTPPVKRPSIFQRLAARLFSRKTPKTNTEN